MFAGERRCGIGVGRMSGMLGRGGSQVWKSSWVVSRGCGERGDWRTIGWKPEVVASSTNAAGFVRSSEEVRRAEP